MTTLPTPRTQEMHRRSLVPATAVAMLVMSLCSFAAGQTQEPTAGAKPVADDAAWAIVGKFAKGEVSLVIEQHEGKYRGKLTKGEKQFDFTGQLKGKSFEGLLEIGATKSPFSATLEEDQLTLTLGIDTYKLARVDSQPSPPFAREGNTLYKQTLLAKSDDVQVSSEVASPDSRRIGFIVQRDGLRFVAVNGVEGKGYRRVGPITFSRDSKRHFYIAEQSDGKLVVVVDEVESEPSDDFGTGSVQFSPDSQRVAFVTVRDGKWRAVIDGKEGTPYDRIYKLRFSPDSKRVAFVGKRDGRRHAVVDGSEQKGYDDIGSEGVGFSPDSKRVVYFAIKGLRQCVVVDGVEGNAHEAVAGFGFSLDSLHSGYIFLREGQYVFVYDGQEKGAYDTINGLSISGNSKRTALSAKSSSQWFQVIDDRPDPKFDGVAAPIFSPDSQRVAYAAMQNGKWSFIQNGKAGLRHDQIPYYLFSPDSKRLAYLAVEADKMYCVEDGKPVSERFDQIWRNAFYFSPDSKHLVFGASRQDRSFLVVDGIESVLDGQFLSTGQLVFESGNQFRTIIRRGPSYYRLDVKIVEPGK